jgi:hypothetical protein
MQAWQIAVVSILALMLPHNAVGLIEQQRRATSADLLPTTAVPACIALLPGHALTPLPTFKPPRLLLLAAVEMYWEAMPDNAGAK